jgi:outer membrane protein assembly factor BamB
VYAAPAVGHGEVVWVEETSQGGTALAYSVRDGRHLWSRHIRPRPTSEPVIWRNSVIIASESVPAPAGLTRLNATTGALVWSRTLNTPGLVDSAPAVYRGRIYQTEEGSFCINGRWTSTLTVRKVSTGAQVWSRESEDLACTPHQIEDTEQRSPAIANHLVYLSELNGKRIRVYTTWRGHLTAVVPTGGELVASTPVLAAGHVVVSTASGLLQTFVPTG